jgi:hypothetical protein
MKGPCPNCRGIIEIPKAEITVHAPDEFASAGKTVKGRAILKPLDRQVTVIGVRELLLAAGTFAVMLVLALTVRHFLSSVILRDVIGSAGVTAAAFGMSLFGYYLLRSGDDLEFYEGEDLCKRAGICTAVYTVSWILFEFFVRYMSLQGSMLIWVYMIPLAMICLFTAYAVFDLDYPAALIHYSFFLICIIILRWAIGFGWIWMAASQILPGGNSGRPPAPVL